MPWYQTRQVAKLIGVNESTVRENTAGFPAPGKKKDKKNNGTSVAGTGNPASPLSGAAAAKAVESKIVVAIADHHATTARVHPIGCAPHETHTFRSAPTTSVDAAPMNFPSWSGDVPTHRCVQVSTRVRNGHLVYTERVGGSNPSPPTSLRCELRLGEADLAIVPKGAPQAGAIYVQKCAGCINAGTRR
jgi:hypothetical protein